MSTDKLALPGSKYYTQTFKVGTIINMGPGYKLLQVISLHNTASDIVAVFELDSSVPTEVIMPKNNPITQSQPQQAMPQQPMASVPLGKRD